MPLERLEHEIVQLAAQINAGTCRWLELVAEFDRREGWASWSCRSCAEWVAWRCALDTRSAREHVRVARRLGELPLIHAAFARGELSYSKVRALTRVAEPDSEADLLELASQATAAQLERIVRGLRRVSTADATESHAMRYLSTWWEADGTLSINGSLPAEEGAAFLIALDAMHDLIRATAAGEAEPSVAPACGGAPSGPAEPASEADACGSAEPPEPRSATDADALVAMASAAVAGPGSGHGSDSPARDGHARGAPAPDPASREGPGVELIVHVDAATLESDAPGAARIEDGSALAPETIRRLACDCAIVPLVEGADGSALSVGRRSRSVPAAMGRALRARDATCTFPGCENRRFLDAHHIDHWAHGGETSLDNLVRLCRRHHRLVHEGGCAIERIEDGEVRFTDRHGRRLRAAPPMPRASFARGGVWIRGASGEPGEPAADDPASAPWPGTGERADLDHTLVVLAARLGL